MRRMKCIYIAGPYRAPTAMQIEGNIRNAETASFKVYSLGAVAICPHTQTRFFEGTLTEEFWIEATLNMLARCDAMLVLPGWDESAGTIGEIKYASTNDIPRFYSLEDLDVWLFNSKKDGV